METVIASLAPAGCGRVAPAASENTVKAKVEALRKQDWR
jgi:hypothetical protein